MNRSDRAFDLRDDVDRMAQRFEKAAAATSGDFSGKDATGAVTVTATAEGRLKDVRVSADWRSDLEPAVLGAAVLDAFGASGTARLQEWGGALADDLEKEAPQLRPLPSVSSSLGARLGEMAQVGQSPEETRATLEAMVELLREIRGSIAEAEQDLDLLQLSAISGQSPSGHVEVRLTGLGDLKEVRYDESWLDRTHVVNIGRETVLAYENAIAAVANRGAAAAVAATRLGELRALTSDPVAFEEYLRARR